jgi:hypothetical protein
MESIGDEKRIRALFSELRFADEQLAPGFSAVWQRAQAPQVEPRRGFNLSFVAATALLVFALGALAVWTRYSPPAPAASASGVLMAPADFPGTPIKNKPQVAVAVNHDPSRLKHRQVKSALGRQTLIVADRRTLTKAKSLNDWQSPTASLLTSPSNDLFTSLPQLNENANEMKSFLPTRANEKEK